MRQKIRQKISEIKTNSFDWELSTFIDIKKIVHFGISIHVLSWTEPFLKTTKTQVFFMITEIFWQIFWHNKLWSVFDVVEDSSYRFSREIFKALSQLCRLHELCFSLLFFHSCCFCLVLSKNMRIFCLLEYWNVIGTKYF